MTPRSHWPRPPRWSTPAGGPRSGCPTSPRSTPSSTEWGWTGDRTHDEAELEAVRALRPRLARLWEATEDEAADIVNGLLREGGALPQLVRHDSWDYHVHATSPHAPLADRMAVEAAMAFTDVIREQAARPAAGLRGRRLHDVLVDLSKNSSRRFCDAACGNRMNVAAYRRRRSAAPATRP